MRGRRFVSVGARSSEPSTLGSHRQFWALDSRASNGSNTPLYEGGATWAAFATYQQFYLDGNKRTGRYGMNAVLMSHGFDAILIPEHLKAQYEDVLVKSYRTGDLMPHIDFLLGLYAEN